MKVGIIGCGHIAIEDEDSHLKGYQECIGVKTIVFCDSKKKEAYGIKIDYSDYMEMVKKEHLDIVSVCTPVETHCQIVRNIAPYVKAIYCEKPIACSLEAANAMIEDCHKYGVILQVNHQRRFIPVKARFSRGVLDSGTHMFDRLRQLFGEMTFNNGNLYLFGSQWVEIEYVDSQEHIFEIDCVRTKERMIKRGVYHLVECLKEGKESISSGEEAMLSLKALLSYEQYREDIKNW